MSHRDRPARESSAVKLALLAERLRAELREIDVLQAEPIAVIGMGCRFPGGATSPDRYWQLLEQGRDGVVEVPPDRWDASVYYDPAPGVRGKMTTRSGGFLEHVDQFDPAFFGLSPREASRMDPQQRLLLEVAHEALDDAGLTRERLAGSDASVYVASTAFDYGLMQLSDERSISAHTVTGSVHCILANRLSFLLDLHGPSLSLDTACSSSLVAVHLACQSLRAGETSLALAGGVNVVLSPAVGVSLSDWGMLAADGRCKTFDARADGFVRGEGCGVVVLKRLAEAIADGDTILAVVRGSAVNQDGRSTAMTAPNGMAQRAVIRQALERAGLAPAQVTFVEAHGTGTALGDPIEVEALAEVYGRPREDGQPLVLGAVKSNIGHLEAAAGVAGLIKTVLALQHQVIPRNLHFQQLNAHISFDGTRLAIPTETRPWPAGAFPRVAGVSSFGFGGTNAHVVVEESPTLPARAGQASGPFLLPLSAHTAEALRTRASDMRALIRESDTLLADVTFTAATRRTHYEHRVAVVGHSGEEMAARLQGFLDGEQRPGWAAGVRQPGAPPRVAFVFSGQGSQWWGMGRELLRDSPVFRSSVEECDRLLRPLAGWSLMGALLADESSSKLDRTDVAQPALLALQAGLVAVWREWGVTPAAVVGHSVGEIAAAYAAGVLSLADAVRVAYHRGRLMHAVAGRGRMAAVELAACDAEQLLASGGYADRLAVAAVNGPSSVVLSGGPDALADVLSVLERQGVRSRLLNGSYAFHSPQMAPLVDRLIEALEGVQAAPATITLVSTVTGRVAAAGSGGPTYWGRNLRERVRFTEAIDTLLAEDCTAFVEIGPHPVLSVDLKQCVGARGLACVAAHSLRRGQPDQSAMLANLGTLFANGCRIDWQGLYPGPGRVVALPPYPFQRQRYWFEQSPDTDLKTSAGSATGHPLLGRRLRSPALEGDVFEATWDPRQPSFLADHRLEHDCVAPATALVEVAAAAGEQVLGPGPCRLEGFAIQEALLLPERAGTLVQVIANRGERGAIAVKIVSGTITDDPPTWKHHASVQIRPDVEPPSNDSLTEARALCTEPLRVDAYYQHLWDLGIRFGPAFRAIADLWRSTPDHHDALSRITAPDALHGELDRYRLHPALLDACFQTLGATFLGDGHTDVFLPIGFDRLTFHRPAGPSFWCLARAIETGNREVRRGDLLLMDDAGVVLAAVEGLQLKHVSSLALRRDPRQPRPDLLAIEWQHAALVRDDGDWTREVAGRWLLLADDRGVGRSLARRLAAQGGNCVLAWAGPAGTQLHRATEQPDGVKACWWLDPAEPAHIRELLGEAGAEPSWRGVVILWGLDTPSVPEGLPPHATLVRSCAGLLHVTQAVSRLRSVPPIWVVTRGAQSVKRISTYGGAALTQAPVWGLAATVGLEHPDLPVVCVDLDPFEGDDEVRALCEELRAGGQETRIAYRDGQRLTARLAPRAPRRARSSGGLVEVVASGSGVLDDLRLQPAARRTPGPGEVEIRVRAAGLNFRDVLAVLGMYPGAAVPLGGECAGEVSATGPGVQSVRVGDEVMAVAVDSFRSYVVTRADLVTRKPAGLTFEAAAGLPSAFLTALYALIRCARVRPGERVLVHAAAGGVGMAATQVARRAGAEVLATAGSPEKRAFLRTQGLTTVMDSRTLSFAHETLAATENRGVDVVLNALTGDFIPASLSALAADGRFVEMGKRGTWSVAQVAQVRPAATYHPFDLSEVIHDRPQLVQSMLGELVHAVESGELHALPTQVFPLSQAADAFRLMAQARHIGKIVLVPEREQDAAPVRADGTYLLTGGLGDLGLHVAGWLIDHGARYLVLAGRGPATPKAAAEVARLSRRGACIHAARADVTSRDALQALLGHLPTDWPPLRGVIHAAGALDDGVLAEQAWPRFASVLGPKVDGAWHLHQLTGSSPLDFFVMFSSAASVLGSKGQGSYAAANAFLDALAHWRLARGLPALSVNWGPWAGTGMAARLDPREQQRLTRQGLEFMTKEQALGALDTLLRDGDAQALAIAVDWPTYVRQLPGLTVSSLLERLTAPAHGESAAPKPASKQTLRDVLAVTPPDRVRLMLAARLRDQAARVLGLDAGRAIDPRQPLQELGLDSLMAVELRNALATDLGCPLSATLLFDHPTLDALADRIMRELAPVSFTPARAVDGIRMPSSAAEVVAMSEAEAEASLLDEIADIRRQVRHE